MSENSGYGQQPQQPDPDQNRREWLASHPGAEEVTPEAAQGQVASHIGAGTPDAGVSDAQLGAQMAAQGAAPGQLPHEDAMNALMEQIRQLSDQVLTLQRRDHQREQAQIAALGEPILQRYANGLRDKLKAHMAANPGLGQDHFGPVIAAAEKLSQAAADAISRGANDLGQVHHAVNTVNRWLSKTHPRTAPAHLRHLDLGSVLYDLEKVAEEAARLAPGVLALA